jgi:hypothetical protein
VSLAGPLDAERILDVLARREVAFVVIGAFAAELWGVDGPRTLDIDFTPASDAANLRRLSLALDELGARIRTEGVPGGLPFSHDGPSLARAGVWNLTCPAGDFDLSFVPSGTSGFDDLAGGATRIHIGGHDVAVASLDDVIRSKTAAGRPKDIVALPRLIEAADRLRAEQPATDPPA